VYTQYRPQRIEFCFRDIAVEDKNHKIRSARHFFGKRLTIFTTRLIKARRIDQKCAAHLLFIPGFHG
jgi:hypothetical protein